MGPTQFRAAEPSSAAVTLPQLNFLRGYTKEQQVKVCYGDIHRALAPTPPPEFVPDEYTLKQRAKHREWERQSRIKATLKGPQPRRFNQHPYDWRPEIIARMNELIDDYKKSRREVAEILNKEYPQPVKLSKSSVVIKYNRTKHGRWDYGLTRRSRASEECSDAAA